MSLNDILSTIDADIARLQQVRALLTGSGKGGRGRKSVTMLSARPKRTLSPEGRKRIAEAQRKRWAARKKAAK
jgi:hypothetical protein